MTAPLGLGMLYRRLYSGPSVVALKIASKASKGGVIAYATPPMRHARQQAPDAARLPQRQY